MKKVVFLLSLLALSFATNAQHYVGVSADVKSAFQLDQLPETRFASGGGAQLGFTYEFQRNMFVLNTGLSASYTATTQLLDSMHFQVPMFDSQGLPVDYHGILDSRHDISQQLHIKAPILLGLEGGHFYGIVGLVFDFSFRAWTTQKAKLFTVADYGEGVSIVPEELTRKDFVTTKSHGRLKYRPDLRLSAELGTSFLLGNQPVRPKLKVGMFFEYGLNDCNSEEIINNPLYKFETQENLKVNMNHIYTTSAVYGSRINNLEIGIRAHILFNVGGISTNGGCNCHRRLL